MIPSRYRIESALAKARLHTVEVKAPKPLPRLSPKLPTRARLLLKLADSHGETIDKTVVRLSEMIVPDIPVKAEPRVVSTPRSTMDSVYSKSHRVVLYS